MLMPLCLCVFVPLCFKITQDTDDMVATNTSASLSTRINTKKYRFATDERRLTQINRTATNYTDGHEWMVSHTLSGYFGSIRMGKHKDVDSF